MKKLTLISALFLSAVCAAAQDNKDAWLIDTPAAEAVEQYGASFTTRFFSQGSVMETFEFGVYPNLNVGFAISAQNLVGNELPVRVLEPAFLLRYKLYEGSLYLPAIAIGYDGRKYGYDKPSDEYLYDEKGAYIVLSREVIIPNLYFAAGGNMSDWDSSDVFFFTSVSFDIENKFKLMAEWDNVHNISHSRLNAGGRFYINEAFSIDAAVRDVTEKDFERLIQVNYTTSF